MKPIIYCYLDQINHIISSKDGWGTNSNIHWGIAFEKNNEYVYHLYTEPPSVIPSGVPLPSIFTTLALSPEANIPDICLELKSKGAQNNGKNARVFCFLNIDLYGRAKVRGFINKNDNEFLEAEIKFVPGKEQLYSRAKGILEHSLLEDTKVTIIGLGSFGSYVAIELAKAGVGGFQLIDFDRLELSNIARHQCGINDLGRYKTKAISDLIKQKNPYARITTFEFDINKNTDVFSQSIQDSNLILCLTDNNESRNRVNALCLKLNKTCIFGRAITRAEAGDIFILSGDSPEEVPCLTCLVGMGLFKKEDDERTQFNKVRQETPAYVPDSQVEATIQVGLSSDINPICNMIVKLSLLELCRGKNSGLDSLYDDLQAKYYLWVNRREDKYINWDPMKFFANKPSILRWYGAKVKRNSLCPSCNQEAFFNSIID